MVWSSCHSRELWVDNIFFPLQTNGTDSMAKKSASLTGTQTFVRSPIHIKSFNETHKQKKYPSRKSLIRRIFVQACHCAALWSALSLSTQRIIYKPLPLCPAEKGIKLVQEGQYEQAVAMFTEAIKCDPKDYRYGRVTHDLFICINTEWGCSDIKISR